MNLPATIPLIETPALTGDWTPDEWRTALTQVGKQASQYQWLIGDLCHLAYDRYQDDTTGLSTLWTEAANLVAADHSTIAKWRQVAAAIPPESRHPNLAWGVHEAAAYVPEPTRSALLEAADQHRWTRHDVRNKVAEIRALAEKAARDLAVSDAPDLGCGPDSEPEPVRTPEPAPTPKRTLERTLKRKPGKPITPDQVTPETAVTITVWVQAEWAEAVREVQAGADQLSGHLTQIGLSHRMTVA